MSCLAHVLTSSSSSFTSAFALLAGILRQVQKPLKDSLSHQSCLVLLQISHESQVRP